MSERCRAYSVWSANDTIRQAIGREGFNEAYTIGQEAMRQRALRICKENGDDFSHKEIQQLGSAE